MTTQLYDWMINQAPAQAPSQPASAAVDTSSAPMAVSGHAAISWIGILIALILLRLVYEYAG